MSGMRPAVCGKRGRIGLSWVGGVLVWPLALWAAAATQPAGERYWKKDAVALRQEIDAFTTLQDGQPAAPGDWELEMDSGWSTRSHRQDRVLVEPVLKYTPHRYTSSRYEFFEAMQLSLRMPLDIGRGEVQGNGDLTFGWQERWIAEHDGIPTISTLAEIRMPSGVEHNGADGTFTGILAKDLGPGTVYLNGWVRTANGGSTPDAYRRTATSCLGPQGTATNGLGPSSGLRQLVDANDECDRRHFQWGFRAGYQWRLRDRTSLIADYVNQASDRTGHANVNLLELAVQFRTKHHLSFGPGVLVGLDGNPETPRFGAGFRFVYLFNARNPPPE